MKKIILVDAQKYTEIVNTLEVVLDRTFQGASLTTLSQAVEARLDELEIPVEQETVFNNDALEIGVLKELLKNLGSLGGFQAPRPANE